MGVIQKLIINNNNHFLFNSANDKIYPCYKYYVAGAILYKSGYPRLIFHELAFFGYLQGGYIIFTA